MKNLNRIITESIHYSVNQMINEDIQRQRRIIEQVLIDEGFGQRAGKFLGNMLGGLGSVGSAFYNAFKQSAQNARNQGAYGYNNYQMQQEAKNITNVITSLNNLMKQGVITNQIANPVIAKLQTYYENLQNNINQAYNPKVDYRTPQGQNAQPTPEATGGTNVQATQSTPAQNANAEA